MSTLTLVKVASLLGYEVEENLLVDLIVREDASLGAESISLLLAGIEADNLMEPLFKDGVNIWKFTSAAIRDVIHDHLLASQKFVLHSKALLALVGDDAIKHACRRESMRDSRRPSQQSVEPAVPDHASQDVVASHCKARIHYASLIGAVLPINDVVYALDQLYRAALRARHNCQYSTSLEFLTTGMSCPILLLLTMCLLTHE